MHRGLTMLDNIFWAKASGAAIGASIAVVFKPGGDSRLKLIQRVVIGTIIGFISAPAIIDYTGLDHTPDYWLASATLGGLLGYLALQFLFSDKAAEAAKALVEKKVEKL